MYSCWDLQSKHILWQERPLGPPYKNKAAEVQQKRAVTPFYFLWSICAQTLPQRGLDCKLPEVTEVTATIPPSKHVQDSCNNLCTCNRQCEQNNWPFSSIHIWWPPRIPGFFSGGKVRLHQCNQLLVWLYLTQAWLGSIWLGLVAFPHNHRGSHL